MSDNPNPEAPLPPGRAPPPSKRIQRQRERARARRARQRDERYEGPGDVAVAPVGLSRGHNGDVTTKHGFYRKALQPDEVDVAEALHAEMMQRYRLDDLADSMLLFHGIASFVKSLRAEPDTDPGDKNVRSYAAFYARGFGEAMDRLGLSRAKRKENDNDDKVAEALAQLFQRRQAKPAPVSDQADEQPATSAAQDGEGEASQNAGH